MEDNRDHLQLNEISKIFISSTLDEFIPLMTWKKEKVIMDAGCGQGQNTAGVLLTKAEKRCTVKHMIGFDKSIEAVKFATENCNRQNVSFVEMDIENIDKTLFNKYKHYCDKIFTFFCLHWIKDIRLAFANMYNFLKPSGELMLLFMADADIFALLEEIYKTKKWESYISGIMDTYGPFRHFNNSLTEFNETIESLGYCIIHSDIDEYSYTIKNIRHFHEFVAIVFDEFKAIPVELQPEFLKTATQCLQHLKLWDGDESKPIILKYNGIRAIARTK